MRMGPILTIAHFQSKVKAWALECFGEKIAANLKIRNHRFLEEALELYQANGLTEAEAKRLVKYVFGRPQGEAFQEVGGVMITLNALCAAMKISIEDAANRELDRISQPEIIKKIREKSASKPSFQNNEETDDEKIIWFSMDTAPKDRPIWVMAAPLDDLNGFECECQWHENAGFCVDELRHPIAWRELQ